MRYKVIQSRGNIYMMQGPDGTYTVERATDAGKTEILVKTTEQRIAEIVYIDYAADVGV
jgi:hypothetical protein